MTNRGHTEGPWQIMGESIVAGNWTVGMPEIAMVGGANDEQLKANAELIAQAPELLKQRDALLDACKLSLGLIAVDSQDVRNQIIAKITAALSLCNGEGEK